MSSPPPPRDDDDAAADAANNKALRVALESAGPVSSTILLNAAAMADYVEDLLEASDEDVEAMILKDAKPLAAKRFRKWLADQREAAVSVEKGPSEEDSSGRASGRFDENAVKILAEEFVDFVQRERSRRLSEEDPSSGENAEAYRLACDEETVLKARKVGLAFAASKCGAKDATELLDSVARGSVGDAGVYIAGSIYLRSPGAEDALRAVVPKCLRAFAAREDSTQKRADAKAFRQILALWKEGRLRGDVDLWEATILKGSLDDDDNTQGKTPPQSTAAMVITRDDVVVQGGGEKKKDRAAKEEPFVEDGEELAAPEHPSEENVDDDDEDFVEKSLTRRPLDDHHHNNTNNTNNNSNATGRVEVPAQVSMTPLSTPRGRVTSGGGRHQRDSRSRSRERSSPEGTCYGTVALLVGKKVRGDRTYRGFILHDELSETPSVYVTADVPLGVGTRVAYAVEAGKHGKQRASFLECNPRNGRASIRGALRIPVVDRFLGRVCEVNVDYGFFGRLTREDRKSPWPPDYHGKTLFFHFSEVAEVGISINLHDVVEFSIDSSRAFKDKARFLTNPR
mmetsp:Transcript_9568/g.31245  ORF Transcript_9568/g.31245 Transcript_9568/m.31245 type:complete len:569 (-) Transcript_9568:204-1910(-)